MWYFLLQYRTTHMCATNMGSTSKILSSTSFLLANTFQVVIFEEPNIWKNNIFNIYIKKSSWRTNLGNHESGMKDDSALVAYELYFQGTKIAAHKYKLISSVCQNFIDQQEFPKTIMIKLPNFESHFWQNWL